MNTGPLLEHQGYEISILRFLSPDTCTRYISFTIKNQSEYHHICIRYDKVFGFIIEDNDSMNLNWLACKLDKRFEDVLQDKDIWSLDDYSLTDIGKSLQICIAMRNKTRQKIDSLLIKNE